MGMSFGKEPSRAERIRRQQGALIKKYREHRGLSQSQFAAKFDPPLTVPAISKWENGKHTPRQERQIEICDVLDMPWSAIFGLGR